MKPDPIVELLQKESTLIEFIEDRAREIPDHKAIIFQNQVITYKELNQKADVLATSLIQMGVQANDRIAVILPNRPGIHCSMDGCIQNRCGHSRVELSLSVSRTVI